MTRSSNASSVTNRPLSTDPVRICAPLFHWLPAWLEVAEKHRPLSGHMHASPYITVEEQWTTL